MNVRSALRAASLSAFVLVVAGPGTATAAADTAREHVAYPAFSSPTARVPDVTAGVVGDVDGDGREDIAFAARSFDAGYPSSVWVSFSDGPGTEHEAGEAGWRGMHIVGDAFSRAVTGLPDVNGDGLGEVAVRGPSTVSVVFGRTDGQLVDVSVPGSWGFRITGVPAGSESASGTAQAGSTHQSETLVSAGDQNGDGRADLAVSDPHGYSVLYTPAMAAGATLNGAAPGAGGFRVTMGSTDSGQVLTMRDVGDLDGDGRADLAVGWTDRPGGSGFTLRVCAVVSPGAGATRNVDDELTAGRAYALVAPDTMFTNVITVGDQNGDGRPELAVSLVPAHTGDWRLVIVYPPALGQTRTIRPLGAGEGLDLKANNDEFVDLGDQDGDGRSDVSYGSHAWMSATDTSERIVGDDRIVLGTVADRSGDGRRDVLTVTANPYRMGPPAVATWHTELFPLQQPPVIERLDQPKEIAEGMSIAMKISSGLNFSDRGRVSSGTLTVSDVAGGDPVAVPLPALGLFVNGTNPLVLTPAAGHLQAGHRYTYSVRAQNLWGVSAEASGPAFSYAGPKVKPPVKPPVKPATPKGRTLKGTRRANRLTGTAGKDKLYGMAGNDTLKGLGNADLLDGGSGRDTLVGGAGRDVVRGGSGDDVIDARDGERDTIDCGTGRDRVKADRTDRLRHCERVTRTKG